MFLNKHNYLSLSCYLHNKEEIIAKIMGCEIQISID